MTRIFLVLLMISLSSLFAISVNFDTFITDPDGTGPLVAGSAIPHGYAVDNIYRSLGLVMESTGAGGVLAYNAPSLALSGSNIIIAVPDNPSHIRFKFYDPAGTQAAVTNYFSIATDNDSSSEQFRVYAYNLLGQQIFDSGILTDTTSRTTTISMAGIHQVLFQTVAGNPGIAVDNLVFNPVTVPEPGMLGWIGVIAIFIMRKLAIR